MKNSVTKAIVLVVLFTVMPFAALAAETTQQDQSDQKINELTGEVNNVFRDLAERIKQGKEISSGMSMRIDWLASQGIETGLLKTVNMFFVESLMQARDYLIQAYELRQSPDANQVQIHELLEKTREKLFVAGADIKVFEGIFQNSIPEN